MPTPIIYTNNHLVKKNFEKNAIFFDTTVFGVFSAIRDIVHVGGKILSHPLSGSIKPHETPYKSVMILPTKGSLDFNSLNLIETAIGVLNRYPELDFNLPQNILNDFAVIDLDIMNSAAKEFCV